MEAIGRMMFFDILNRISLYIEQAIDYLKLVIILSEQMGNQQPKKLQRVSKQQIDIAALKAKIHLQLMRDRKNQQIIKGEKELVNKMKSQNRNKVEELLIAERVVNGLKYAQACNILMGYAATIRAQAHFISENIFNPQKIQPWLPYIYSLIYAADHLGLSSLAEFKALMRAMNDPTGVLKHVDPEILNLLTPSPKPQQLNMYILEMGQRNNFSLQQINMGGHKFTKQWNIPSVTPSNNNSEKDELERQLAEQLAMNFGGKGGMFNPYNPYGHMDPNQLINPNSNNPYGNMNNNNINNNQNKVENQIPQKTHQDPKMSITSLNDIDYYPEIDPKGGVLPIHKINDPSFDEICNKLRQGM